MRGKSRKKADWKGQVKMSNCQDCGGTGYIDRDAMNGEHHTTISERCHCHPVNDPDAAYDEWRDSQVEAHFRGIGGEL